MRPKTQAKDLPPRMLRRVRTLASGKVWTGYYYNGRNADGQRAEIPLGTDLATAKRKWAELEHQPAPLGSDTMEYVFARYAREIVPTKAPRTAKENMAQIANLRKAFASAPVSAITPQHIAQYRDKRTAKVSANREISLLSHIYNKAREWGHTTAQNPCTGVAKNKERPQRLYITSAIW
jgi:hypothetical protein